MAQSKNNSSLFYFALLTVVIVAIAGFVGYNIKKYNEAPNITENDYILPSYVFHNGQKISNLKLHYATLGTPVRDTNGRITNAVLLLHATGASSQALLTPNFMNSLYGPGKPLDARKYYLIFPDDVGHGKSSKPSNGLRASFPNYSYQDMVDLQHRLVTEQLGVMHLQMIVGVSMGGMHAWMWSEMYPDFMTAIMPIVALPHKIDGRDLLWRQIVIEAVRTDPDWKSGNYTQQPHGWIALAPVVQMMVGGIPHFEQTITDTATAKRYVFEQMQRAKEKDANDMIYALAASQDYNPEATLENIKAKVYALDFSDDALNPSDLDLLTPLMKRVKNGRETIQPGTSSSYGHMTLAHPELWVAQVAEFKKFAGTDKTVH